MPAIWNASLICKAVPTISSRLHLNISMKGLRCYQTPFIIQRQRQYDNHIWPKMINLRH